MERGNDGNIKSLLLAGATLMATGLVTAKTWTQTSAPTNYWSSIALSADGSKLVAVAGSSPVFTPRISPIYISTNYGSTWTPNTATSNYWSSVASSGVHLDTVLAIVRRKRGAGVHACGFKRRPAA
jgi:hypothetical protein